MWCANKFTTAATEWVSLFNEQILKNILAEYWQLKLVTCDSLHSFLPRQLLASVTLTDMLSILNHCSKKMQWYYLHICALIFDSFGDQLLSVTIKMTWWHANLLTCWHADMLTCWQTDMLTGWHADMMMWWHAYMLTYWHDDMLTWWHGDMLTYWHDDMMTWLHADMLTSGKVVMLTCWHDDVMTCWHADMLTYWHADMLIWRHADMMAANSWMLTAEWEAYKYDWKMIQWVSNDRNDTKDKYIHIILLYICLILLKHPWTKQS